MKPRILQGVAAAWRAVLLVTVLACFGAMQGCSVSHWEEGYVPVAAAPALATQDPVQLREVSWDRLQGGLKELEADQANSDVHPADWPPEKQAEEKAKLLRTLQVSGDPAGVEIVGRSTFRTTTPLQPESDADLAGLARKEGANKVVWSRRLMGKADEIVQEPVTTWGTSYYSGRRHGSTYTESYTTWVPVAVQSDEYAYVAYFLRS
jgi:hypothetical protein